MRIRACRAAVEMRDAFSDLGINGRIGVTTGEVVTGTAERLATGDAVNVAARLEQAAAPGEVLIGAATLALGARRGRCGAGGAAEAEGEGGAGSGVPADLGARRARPALRDADGRPRDRAEAAPRRLRTGGATTAPASSSPCSARRVWGSRGWRRSSSRHRGTGRARPLPVLRRRDHLLASGRDRQAARCAAGRRCGCASPVAARRDGLSDVGRRDRLGLPQADRAGGARSVHSSACSTTCTGRRRRCSIWSSTLPTSPATRPSSCSAWRAPSCSRSGLPGAAVSGTRPPCCSSRSTALKPSGCWTSSAASSPVCVSGSPPPPRETRSSWKRCSRSCGRRAMARSACRRRSRRF